MQTSHNISGFVGPKFTKFIAKVTFSSTVLSFHPVSNERGDIKKVTSVKRKPAGSIAMPGGLISK